MKNMLFNKNNNRKDESLKNPEKANDDYSELLDKLAKSEPIFNDSDDEDR
jgi:hypothetical protein